MTPAPSIPIHRTLDPAHRQLFLDDFLIAHMSGITRKVNAVHKHEHNPVIRPVESWEPTGYCIYGSVLHDQETGTFKCWCAGQRLFLNGKKHIGHAATVSYFTSFDGIQWDRPGLGIIHNNGHDTNFCALLNSVDDPRAWPHAQEPLGVIKDTHDPDPQRRYKLAYLYVDRDYRGPDPDPIDPGVLRAPALAFSSDGIHWHDPDICLSRVTIDGCMQWMRDPSSEKWLLFGRTKHVAPEVLAALGHDPDWRKHHKARAVNRAVSDNLIDWIPNHWNDPQSHIAMAVDVEDGPYAEIYRMHVFPYQGLYIGLVQMFWDAPAPEGPKLDVQLAVSRDALHFERLSDRSPFIPAGDIGDWDRFNITPSTNDPVLWEDQLRFYYDGRSKRHSGRYASPDDGQGIAPYLSAIGFGSIKRDRFAALQAGFEPGIIQTHLLIATGATLHINAAAICGRVTVEVCAPDQSVLQKHALQAVDTLDHPIALTHARHLFSLRFTLHNAKLFSFWID